MTNTLTWRQLFARMPRAMQNASKRAAIERLLIAHPEWSNRRIAAAVHMLIITEDDLDKLVELGGVSDERVT